ncbi:hypothetical protein GC197_13455 [bacterium]|nr:hypothetical protein [bacterium]
MTEKPYWLLIYSVLPHVLFDAFWALLALSQLSMYVTAISYFILMGLLLGQLGTCCTLWLRRRGLWALSSLGIVLVSISAISISASLDHNDFRELSSITTLVFIFTPLYCLGPMSVWRSFSAERVPQFSLRNIFIFTVVVAVLCFAALHYRSVGSMAFATLLIALPSILACIMLVMLDDLPIYTLFSFGTGMLSLVIMGAISGGSPDVLLISVFQSFAVWVGGIQLMLLFPEHTLATNDQPQQ